MKQPYETPIIGEEIIFGGDTIIDSPGGLIPGGESNDGGEVNW